jgi:hypothetical protein
MRQNPVKGCSSALLGRTQNFVNLAWALRLAIWWQTVEVGDQEGYKRAANRFLELLTSPDLIDRCEGALGSSLLCMRLRESSELLEEFAEVLQCIGSKVLPLLFSDSTAETYSANWLLYQLGLSNVWYPPKEPDMLGRLFTLWRHSENPEMLEVAPGTITVQRLVSREGERPCSTIKLDEFESFARNYSEMNDSKENPLPL